MGVTYGKIEVPDEAFDLHSAIVGMSGSGKSFLARKFVEDRLDAKKRVIVVDPTGVWWGIRSGSDGQAKGGKDIALLGGRYGDVAITPADGHALGAMLGGSNMSAVLDVSNFTTDDQMQFVSGMLGELYRVNQHPLHLILDEADEWAPQVASVKGSSDCLDHVARIVKRGRSRGFKCMLITQRPADISKRVVAQVKTLIVKKLSLEIDIKAIKGWIQLNANEGMAGGLLASLPKLKPHEGWVWSPEISLLFQTSFPPISTFDSMKPPAEDAALPIMSVKEGLADLAAILASDDGLVAGTDKGGVPKGWASPDKLAEEILKAEVRGAAKGSASERTRIRHYLQKMIDVEFADTPIPTKKSQAADAKAAAAKQTAGYNTPAPRIDEVIPLKMGTVTHPAVIPANDPAKTPAIGGSKPSAFAVGPWLDAIHKVAPAKLTWGQIGAIIGKKARGGFFNSIRQTLIRDGLVIEQNGRAVPTKPPPMPAGMSPAEVLCERLPSLSGRLFNAIHQKPGMSWQAYADELGVKAHGGFWNSARQMLRGSDLVVENGEAVSIHPDLAKGVKRRAS